MNTQATQTAATETNAAATVAALFELASRKKLRFDNPNGGQLSVEDLWDLDKNKATMPTLDKIAVALFKKLREGQEMSFVSESTGTVDELTQLKFDIARHVIETRKAENVAKAQAQARADRRRQLQDALDQAERGELASMSADQIRELLKNA